jgi:hypothetical protein
LLVAAFVRSKLFNIYRTNNYKNGNDSITIKPREKVLCPFL